ncbi:hypothetical protein [Fictibacillus barbaricus]|uniref:Uncharacterized protein n=1 Tax=Fictibacillus barbaricus TaxID=182136 RepID=A0ABS2Z9K5_9BACL|nr:hypothetical protein [Fictibacillus barbaricus]MBN3543973.1 hypothetical protein [Fictibacillus barbaricus]GGB70073.1 hypothetical protein GCM10007199_40360 [Fictibacillus barbaricus]
MKTQTKERAQIIYLMLEEISLKKNASKEQLNRLTEIAQLLKEDVEIGEKTSGVLDDISEFGEKALKLSSEKEMNDFLKQEDRKIEEYYEHFKMLFKEE